MASKDNRKNQSILISIEKIINKITDYLGYFVAFLIVFMTTVMFAQVILRYVFGTSIRQLTILVRFSISWMTFVGSAIALKTQDHLEIEIFPESTPKIILKIRNFIVDIVTFFVIFILLRVGHHAFNLGFAKAELVDRRITQGYYYSSLFIGAILMLIFFTWHLVKRYIIKNENLLEEHQDRSCNIK
ncbi:TRAP transporter small permease [Halanaerobium hydrogeniformans]|uniref:Tripartite ATP-independent periplasmic transporter DctQ component n=1 Tax=Halanaerobium hydrogeniformans TaxID=656519 RepID=E4RPK8_HALHG|nr:TRAP transporter small permease [Halanaerobium hydrogeniformans]ADQ14031.1 Tripartite ATP-independent periplasmic transporter DctQ component [Halanaerobium hydrogeniformans]